MFGCFFFFKQKTAYEMRISDWSSDVCSSDLIDAISQAVPLLARVYPNGDADVNRFAACGGTQFVFRELLDAGLMHADIATVVPGGMRAYYDEPRLAADGTLDHAPGIAASARSEEHTSELQSLMRISYAVFCLKKKQLH